MMEERIREIRVCKLHPGARMPVYASAGAAGADVFALLDKELVLKPFERALVPTGLSFSIPDGYEVQLRPRSGLALKQGVGLPNSPGTIDADYRGEVRVLLVNLGSDDVVVRDGDRIAQMVLAPVYQACFVQDASLDDTERGSGGFGSTGLSGL